MKLSVSLSSKKVVNLSNSVTTIAVKRRDGEPFEVNFLDTVTQLPIIIPDIPADKLRITIGFKKVGEYDGPAIVWATTAAWTFPTVAGQPYRVSPVFSGDPLDDLFAGEGDAPEKPFVELMGEITWWNVDTPLKPSSTQDIKTIVRNDIVRGDEALPPDPVAPYPDAPVNGTVLYGDDDGAGNAIWTQKTRAQMMVLLGLVNVPAVTGGAGALDTFPTIITAHSGVATGTTFRVLTGDLAAETLVQEDWTLVAGTHANGDSWRQPLDYHAVNNARTWVKTR